MFISFGAIDKKLLILVLCIIVNLINLIVSNEVPDNYLNDILSSLLDEVGPIIAGTILIFTLKQKQKETKDDKKSFKYIFILFLLRLGRSSYERIFPYVVTDTTYRFNKILNTTNAIEINLTTLGTFILLKYKYHKHHIVSLIIFFVLGVTSDFIMKSYFAIKYTYFYVYIYYVIVEVSLFCYLKYMMDKLYYPYMEVLLYWGLTGLIEKLFIFSGFIIYEHKNNIDGIIHEFYVYFTETSAVVIIFFEFLYELIISAVDYLLLMLVLFYLRPNHLIFSDEINVFIRIICYREMENKYYTIIPFIFQIFILFFYFEILEFNFCNLNYNTAKNIEKRGENIYIEDDINVRPSRTSLIELGGNYYLNNDNNNNKMDNDDNLNRQSLNDKDNEPTIEITQK